MTNSLLGLHVLTLCALGCCRYVDMLVTEGVRDAFRARARMTSATRRLLEARGFLEVGVHLATICCKPSVQVNRLCLSDMLRILLALHALRNRFAGAQRLHNFLPVRARQGKAMPLLAFRAQANVLRADGRDVTPFGDLQQPSGAAFGGTACWSLGSHFMQQAPCHQ